MRQILFSTALPASGLVLRPLAWAMVALLVCQGCRNEDRPGEVRATISDSTPAAPAGQAAELGAPPEAPSLVEESGIESLDSLLAGGEVGDTTQVQVVVGRCAVSVSPNDSVIEAYQSQAGDDGWNEIVDDNVHYTALVTDTLQAHGVPLTHASRQRRYVRFVALSGGSFTVDLAKGKELWGLFLFDGKEKPVLWHSTELSPEWKRRMLTP